MNLFTVVIIEIDFVGMQKTRWTNSIHWQRNNGLNCERIVVVDCSWENSLHVLTEWSWWSCPQHSQLCCDTTVFWHQTSTCWDLISMLCFRQLKKFCEFLTAVNCSHNYSVSFVYVENVVSRCCLCCYIM